MTAGMLGGAAQALHSKKGIAGGGKGGGGLRAVGMFVACIAVAALAVAVQPAWFVRRHPSPLSRARACVPRRAGAVGCFGVFPPALGARGARLHFGCGRLAHGVGMAPCVYGLGPSAAV
jgi:hypothetical protein